MTNKNIWILNQTAGTPESGWGERHFYLANYWIKKGYDVKIISGSYNHLFRNQPKIGANTFSLENYMEGITFCWVKIPNYNAASIFKLWSMMVFAFKVLFLKASLLGKPDIIIVSSMPIFPIISGWFLKKKYKAEKLIFEIRDLWPLTPMYLSGYSKWHPVIVLMRWMEAFGYRKSDAIVSVLPKSDTYINGISKDPSKFHWIPNGTDPTLLKFIKIEDSIKNKLPKNKFIVGYTGTMGMANALEYMAKACVLMKKDTSVHFVFVGDGYLKKKLQTITIGCKNVTFIPKIAKNQVQDMLSYFDCCFIGRNNVALFDHGVSSNKYFDYMLAKKPVLVSSNRVGCPVEQSEAGMIVAPENAREIVAGIKKIQQLSTREVENIVTKGYKHVLKYHNFEFLSAQYMKLF